MLQTQICLHKALRNLTQGKYSWERICPSHKTDRICVPRHVVELRPLSHAANIAEKYGLTTENRELLLAITGDQKRFTKFRKSLRTYDDNNRLLPSYVG